MFWKFDLKTEINIEIKRKNLKKIKIKKNTFAIKEEMAGLTGLLGTNQPINQSTNQSINQSIN